MNSDLFTGQGEDGYVGFGSSKWEGHTGDTMGEVELHQRQVSRDPSEAVQELRESLSFTCWAGQGLRLNPFDLFMGVVLFSLGSMMIL